MAKDKLLEIMRSVRACVDYSRYHWKTIAEGETLELALKGVDILQSMVDMQEGEPSEIIIQPKHTWFVNKENRDWWKLKSSKLQNELYATKAELNHTSTLLEQLSHSPGSVADKPVMTIEQFCALNNLIKSRLNSSKGENTYEDVVSATNKAREALCGVTDSSIKEALSSENVKALRKFIEMMVERDKSMY